MVNKLAEIKRWLRGVKNLDEIARLRYELLQTRLYYGELLSERSSLRRKNARLLEENERLGTQLADMARMPAYIDAKLAKKKLRAVQKEAVAIVVIGAGIIVGATMLYAWRRV